MTHRGSEATRAALTLALLDGEAHLFGALITAEALVGCDSSSCLLTWAAPLRLGLARSGCHNVSRAAAPYEPTDGFCNFALL